ncbi:hypothetical protein FB45DRAFT_868348 [Roridomyces roridus]|uniref:Uncharacterized protein n=1 Tax=Roridomyces roridus TaxID=1738132 RepID=A0AAD7BPP0_9AGAR|nr:hypothetical protein FB45DRAFT_868348 [Roridomyces roridus]
MNHSSGIVQGIADALSAWLVLVCLAQAVNIKILAAFLNTSWSKLGFSCQATWTPIGTWRGASRSCVLGLETIIELNGGLGIEAWDSFEGKNVALAWAKKVCSEGQLERRSTSEEVERDFGRVRRRLGFNSRRPTGMSLWKFVWHSPILVDVHCPSTLLCKEAKASCSTCILRSQIQRPALMRDAFDLVGIARHQFWDVASSGQAMAMPARLWCQFVTPIVQDTANSEILVDLFRTGRGATQTWFCSAYDSYPVRRLLGFDSRRTTGVSLWKFCGMALSCLPFDSGKKHTTRYSPDPVSCGNNESPTASRSFCRNPCPVQCRKMSLKFCQSRTRVSTLFSGSRRMMEGSTDSRQASHTCFFRTVYGPVLPRWHPNGCKARARTFTVTRPVVYPAPNRVRAPFAQDQYLSLEFSTRVKQKVPAARGQSFSNVTLNFQTPSFNSRSPPFVSCMDPSVGATWEGVYKVYSYSKMHRHNRLSEPQLMRINL